MKKMNNAWIVTVDIVKDKKYILNAIEKSKIAWWKTTIEKAYLEWLDYVNNLDKNAI
jgi:hypothetical protein